MKQALKEVEDIKRMREAIKKTNSPCLIRDYQKAIDRKIRALKEYCTYRGINYKALGL